MLLCSATVYKLKKWKNRNLIGIVFSTAGYAMLPLSGQKVYNSSKTALTYLTEGLRHELAHVGSKIKVTVSLKNSCS